MSDPTLFDIQPLVRPECDPSLTIQERFDAFHAANPWVLTALEALIADWLAHDNAKVGIKQMFEVIRWRYGRATTDTSFRLNNNWTSRYARLALDLHPEWAHAIETRVLRAA